MLGCRFLEHFPDRMVTFDKEDSCRFLLLEDQVGHLFGKLEDRRVLFLLQPLLQLSASVVKPDHVPIIKVSVNRDSFGPVESMLVGAVFICRVEGVLG